MPREEIYTVRSPRAAAINFVTSNGRDRLRVTGWLNASRPSGGQPHYSYTTGVSFVVWLANIPVDSYSFFYNNAV